MGEATRLGLTIVAVGLVEGILGDLLLREGFGLNVFLWVGTLVLAAVALVRRSQTRLAGEARWLVLPLLFFAAGFAWRDAALLRILDFFLLVGTASLALLRVRSGSLREAGIVNYVVVALAGLGHALFGPLFLASRDITWEELPRGRRLS